MTGSSESLLITEDGILELGDSIKSIIFHQNLNVFIVVTAANTVRVFDPHSSLKLTDTSLENYAGLTNDNIRCMYLRDSGGVIFSGGKNVGLRQDHQGVLLLNTILQTQVTNPEKNVELEILFSEALQLQQVLGEVNTVENASDVREALSKALAAPHSENCANPKVGKWRTVCLNMPLGTLRSVCSSLVSELRHLAYFIPALSLASSLNHRLNHLTSPTSIDVIETDKEAMFSEAARLATFCKWPHMNYKWALPDQMAQAGFFHQPVASDDDRAMCFICNVCLVYWEPTDEPWSEHERHAPNCPYVKGEYTHNVPLSVTHATGLALTHSSRSEEIYSISFTNSKHFIATTTRNGNIVIWNVFKELKKESTFSVDPSDSTILDKHFSDTIGYTDIPLQQSLPAEAWPMKRMTSISYADNLESGCKSSSVEDNTDFHVNKDDTLFNSQISPNCKISNPSVTFLNMETDNKNSDFNALISNGSDCKEFLEEVLQMDQLSMEPSSDVSSYIEPKISSSSCPVSIEGSSLVKKDEPSCGSLSDSSQTTNSQGSSHLFNRNLKARHFSMDDNSEELFAPPRSSHDVHVSSLCVFGDPSELNNGTGNNTFNKKVGRSCLAVGVGLRRYDIFSQTTADGLVQVLNNVNQSAFNESKSLNIMSINDEQSDEIITNTSHSHVMKENEQIDSSVQCSSMFSQPVLKNFVPYLLIYDLSSLSDSPVISSKASSKGLHQGTSKKSTRRATVSSGYAMALIKMKGEHPYKETFKESTAINGISNKSKTVKEIPLGPTNNNKKSPKCTQCIPLPHKLNKLKLELYVDKILVSLCGQYLLVLLKQQYKKLETNINDNNNVSGGLILYKICNGGDCLTIQEEPLCTKLFRDSSLVPIEIVMVPTIKNDTIAGNLAGCVCYDGSLRILHLSTLEYIQHMPHQDKPFNNLVYCHSLERLCITREDGKVVLVQLREDMAEASDDAESAVTMRVLSALCDNKYPDHFTDKDIEIQPQELLVNQGINAENLDKCIELTNFQLGCPRFVATVPPCWGEIIQAQKQRRNPQHLQHQAEDVDTTRTWRLESDSTTYDEHIFDILLPLGGGSVGNSGHIQVGHIDVKLNFSPFAHQPLPKIQVTLLKQNLTNPLKNLHKQPDTLELFPENPVVTKDFLLTHKAEILCGPVTVNQYLDLSGQAANIALTSPSLLASKSRSFLIHVKAIDPKDVQLSQDSKLNDLELLNQYIPPQYSGGDYKMASMASAVKKVDALKGCNAIKELSLTIHCCSKTSIPYERIQRMAMVEKEIFQKELLDSIVNTSSSDHIRHRALDLFLWILSIQTAANKKIYEVSTVSLLKDSLSSLVKTCILLGDRSLSHKVTKIIISAMESISDSSHQNDFGAAVLKALLQWIELIAKCNSAGSMYWFFSILNHVKWCDQFSTAAKVTELLSQTSEVLSVKTNPLHFLLQTKFSLTGTPLERELFDTFPPLLTKQVSPLFNNQASTVQNQANTTSNNNNINVHPMSSSWSKYDCMGLMYGGGNGKSSATSSPLNGGENCDFGFNLGQNGSSFGLTPHIGGLCGLFEVEPLHFSLYMASDGTKMEKVFPGSCYPGNPYLVDSLNSSNTNEVEFGKIVEIGNPKVYSSMNIVPPPLLNWQKTLEDAEPLETKNHFLKAVEDMENMEMKNQAVELLLAEKANNVKVMKIIENDMKDIEKIVLGGFAEMLASGNNGTVAVGSASNGSFWTSMPIDIDSVGSVVPISMDIGSPMSLGPDDPMFLNQMLEGADDDDDSKAGMTKVGSISGGSIWQATDSPISFGPISIVSNGPLMNGPIHISSSAFMPFGSEGPLYIPSTMHEGSTNFDGHNDDDAKAVNNLLGTDAVSSVCDKNTNMFTAPGSFTIDGSDQKANCVLMSNNISNFHGCAYEETDCDNVKDKDAREPCAHYNVAEKKIKMTNNKDQCKASTNDVSLVTSSLKVENNKPKSIGSDTPMVAKLIDKIIDFNFSVNQDKIVNEIKEQTITKDNDEDVTSTSSSSSSTPKNPSSPIVPKVDAKHVHPVILPYQQLLSLPPQQMIVIERMHSGARRFVVLDFGAPIILTDVIIPACSDLVSLTIDIWLTGEEADGERLAVASDIGIRPLVLSDLQPAPLCRYLKITTLGRYGMITSQCKIPVGAFYGHTIILPWYLQPYQPHVNVLNKQGAKGQLSLLNSLVEDVGCRYSLACSKLRMLLQPLSKLPSSGISSFEAINAGHNSWCSVDLDNKIKQAYQECLGEQQHLNLILAVVRRLQKFLCQKEPFATVSNDLTPNPSDVLCGMKELKKCSSDKLSVLMQHLLNCLLTLTLPPANSVFPCNLLEWCDAQQASLLIEHICIKGPRGSQAAVVSLLSRLCANQQWWGEFLASTIVSLFSSSRSSQIPAARIFALLTFLGQKSVQCGRGKVVIDNIVNALYIQLERGQFIEASYSEEGNAVTNDGNEYQNIFAQPLTHIDPQLVSWLLLYLSYGLDSFSLVKNGENDKLKSRWSWLCAESCMQKTGSEANKGPPKSTRERLRKRLVHHKQQLINLESATKSFGEVMAGLGSVINPNMVKHSEQIFKKIQKQHVMKHFKDLCSIQQNETNSLRRMNRFSGTSQPTSDSKSKNDIPANDDGVTSIDTLTAMKVIKGLVKFLMNTSFPCSVDSYLLTCKVIAGLVKVSRPSLKIYEILTEAQLESLFCHSISLDSMWGAPWALHALTCLLQDILEAERVSGVIIQIEDATQLDSSNVSDTNKEQSSRVYDDYSNCNPSTDDIVGTQDSTIEATDHANVDDISPSGVVDLSELCKDDDQLIVDAIFSQGNNTSMDYLNNQSPNSDSTHSSSGSSTIESPQENDLLFAINSSKEENKENLNKTQSLTNGEVIDLIPKISTVILASQATQSAASVSPPVVNVATSHFSPIDEEEGPVKYSTAFIESGDSSESDDMIDYLTDLNSDLNTYSGPHHHHHHQLLNNLNAENSYTYVPTSVHGSTWVGSVSKYSKESRFGDLITAPLSSSSNKPGTDHSTAVDARLENGISLMAELRIHMMYAIHSSRLHSAMTAPLQQVPSINLVTNPDVYGAGDLKLSVEMLSNVFQNILSQLPLQHDGNQLQKVLELWMNLNIELGGEYNTSLVPLIPLQPPSVSSLLASVARAPNISIKCWCLTMQTLTLCSNLTPSEEQLLSGNTFSSQFHEDTFEPIELCWMAYGIISDKNFVPMLFKLLNGNYCKGSQVRCDLVGGTLTNLFEDLLLRLQVRCDVIRADSVPGNLLKLSLLKLTMRLLEPDAAFLQGLGPLDAQRSLLIFMLSVHYDGLHCSHIPLTIINSIAHVVHGYLSSNEEPHEGPPEQNSSMLGGLFASVLGSDLKQGPLPSRRVILCSMLNLARKLIQLPLQPQRGGVFNSSSNEMQGSEHTAVYLTDSLKLEQQLTDHQLNDNPSMSQTDEHKARQNNPTGSVPSFGASHGQNLMGNVSNERACTHNHPNKIVYIADSVLQNAETMQMLLASLGTCEGNSVTMILLGIVNGDMSEKLGLGETLTDALYQLLLAINHKATDIDTLLAALFRYIQPNNFWCHPQLSEALFCFYTQVLDCKPLLKKFAAMRGIELVWENLVKSVNVLGGGKVGLVASIMNHLAPSLPASTLNTTVNKRVETTSVASENSSSKGLYFNFAPLATVTSSNPTARPADALVRSPQLFPRTKSPPWSYHFYPDENWVDLNFTLPCPILLHEVHLQPHNMSLGIVCPSGVSIEAGVEGGCISPVTGLLNTAGRAYIKIALLNPVVASVIVVRLYKPCDQPTLGLSHLKLLGTTAFRDCARSPNEQSSAECGPYKTSYWWLRLINHCMTHEREILNLTVESGACVTGVMESCITLLLTPSIHSIFTSPAIVDSSPDSLVRSSHQLLSAFSSTLLENTTLSLVTHNRRLLHTLVKCLFQHPLILQPAGSASIDAAVALLYMISLNLEGAKLLVEWLSITVQEEPYLQQDVQSEYAEGSLNHITVNPEILHCIAAVLWNISDDVSYLISEELFRKIYKWVERCSGDIKEGFGHILGSMCKISPQLFTQLMLYMGILTCIDENSTSLTDDRKDREAEIRASRTDDMKEGIEGCGIAGEGRLILQDTSVISLTPDHLQIISLSVQSTPAILLMLDSGFPLLLVHGILEWCKAELLHQVESCTTPSGVCESATDLEKAERGRCKDDSYSSISLSNNTQINIAVLPTLSTRMVAYTLETLTALSTELAMKDWIGSGEGSVFWMPLFTVLGDPVISGGELSLRDTGSTSYSDYSRVEDATIQLMKQCCSNHSANQKMLASTLCHLIQRQNPPPPGGLTYLHSLSGFTRRLVLQTLLESEKVLVHISSSFGGLCTPPSATLPPLSRHPKYGAGHKVRLLYLPVLTKIEDVIKLVTDWWQESVQKSSQISGGALVSNDLDNSSCQQELGEVGLELVDKLSVAAGVTAKEKRNKDKTSKLLPKQMKKGQLPGNSKKRQNTNCPSNMVGSAILATYGLVHENLLGGTNCLPGNLTLAQAMGAVRKFAAGTSTSELSFTLVFHKDFGQDSRETPAAVSLLKQEPLPSILQVFTSLGGLSILAQHMTILYPDTTMHQFVSSVSSKSVSDEKMNEKMFEEDFMGFQIDYLSNSNVPEFFPTTGLGNSPGMVRGGGSVGINPIPPHALGAFTLFLRLPGYAETLFIDTPKACALLRLTLGVTDGLFESDASPSFLSSLATLPFQVLEVLLKMTPLTTDDGLMLRRMCLSTGSLHLILACLAALSHQDSPEVIAALQHSNIPIGLIIATTRASCSDQKDSGLGNRTDSDRCHYWAKGTGFGTGSTNQTWNIEEALVKQKMEEQHVVWLIRLLAQYINPGDVLPPDFEEHCKKELEASAAFNNLMDETNCIQNIINNFPIQTTSANKESFIINDCANKSDKKDVPCEESIITNDQSEGFSNASKDLMHTDSTCKPVEREISILAKEIRNSGMESLMANETVTQSLPPEIYNLFLNSGLIQKVASYLCNDSVLDMSRHVPLYRALMALVRGIAVNQTLIQLLLPPISNSSESENTVSESTKQIPDLSDLLTKMMTTVNSYMNKLKWKASKVTKNHKTGLSKKENNELENSTVIDDNESEDQGLSHLVPEIQLSTKVVEIATERLRFKESKYKVEIEDASVKGSETQQSTLDIYLNALKPLQFDSFEMIVEDGERGIRFVVPYRYESLLRKAGESYTPKRMKRLAQEAVTLSSSLPLSYSSSVFVRTDMDRLDVMKVLITGPEDTPYANGCFEFDVYFPNTYPHSPLYINLQTTGERRVRFNPNLYQDGKVCLSILNTWHGRPEEKWNPQTSSLLQVLVSIQSLIFVPEPYFNEPGYERSRGSQAALHNSQEYDASIRAATVRWAILNQLKSPSPCFKDVIERHFWLKQNEILAQVEGWITEMETLSESRRGGRVLPHHVVAIKKLSQILKEEFSKLNVPKGLEDVPVPSKSLHPEEASADSQPCAMTTTSREKGGIEGGGPVRRRARKISKSNLFGGGNSPKKLFEGGSIKENSNADITTVEKSNKAEFHSEYPLHVKSNFFFKSNLYGTEPVSSSNSVVPDVDTSCEKNSSTESLEGKFQNCEIVEAVKANIDAILASEKVAKAKDEKISHSSKNFYTNGLFTEEETLKCDISSSDNNKEINSDSSVGNSVSDLNSIGNGINELLSTCYPDESGLQVTNDDSFTNGIIEESLECGDDDDYHLVFNP